MKRLDMQVILSTKDNISSRIRRLWRVQTTKAIMDAAREQLEQATDEELTELLNIVRNHK